MKVRFLGYDYTNRDGYYYTRTRWREVVKEDREEFYEKHPKSTPYTEPRSPKKFIPETKQEHEVEQRRIQLEEKKANDEAIMELKKEKEDLFKRKIQNAKQSGEAREGLFEQIFLDYQGK